MCCAPMCLWLFSALAFHRITESLTGRGWKGPLWVIWSNPPAEAGSPRAGCTGPCLGGSGISPEKETPQPPWAAWARAPFQPVAVLLGDTSKEWGQGGSFTLTLGKAAWVGRAGLGRVLAGLAFAAAPGGTVRVLWWGVGGSCHVPILATASPGFSPGCHQQITPGGRTARRQGQLESGESCRCCLLWMKLKQTERLP